MNAINVEKYLRMSYCSRGIFFALTKEGKYVNVDFVEKNLDLWML